uniref:Uncharacterized protein n=1 Tax=Nothoprocta perdicaria TaxID=30464 RepID=A0A8C6YJK9_NOTPE
MPLSALMWVRDLEKAPCPEEDGARKAHPAVRGVAAEAAPPPAGPFPARCRALNVSLSRQVQGWARTAPLACFQLQKQARKGKGSEPGNSCLICSDMLQPPDKGLGQEGKFSGIKTKVHHSTLHSVQTAQGEKMPLPVKEHCAWNLEDLKNPEGVRQKEGKPQGLKMLNPNGPGSSKSSLFPPVKDASPNDTSDPSWKGKMTISSQKRLNGTSVEMAPYNQDAGAVEHEGIKGTDQGMENTEIHEQSSFVPSHTKISVLHEDPEQPPRPGALATNKTTATVPNPIALKKNSHHSCKQLAHLKGIQHTRDYSIQGSSTNSVRNRYVENKQEKEAKEKEVPPLSGLLPSVTASRVARTTLPSRLT